jgi:hypothetical protein
VRLRSSPNRQYKISKIKSAISMIAVTPATESSKKLASFWPTVASTSQIAKLALAPEKNGSLDLIEWLNSKYKEKDFSLTAHGGEQLPSNCSSRPQNAGNG